MKRDLDLVRQILLCIEHRGGQCPLDALRSDLRHESDERVRYHLELVIDAGLAIEIERVVVTPFGVRLTHAGHEFIEVARDDARWRAAKAVVIEESGGQSLGLIKALLMKWAWREVAEHRRHRHPRRRYYRYVENWAPTWWDNAYTRSPSAALDDDQVRLVRRHRRGGRRLLRARLNWRDGVCDDLYGDVADELAERSRRATLPPQVI
jgi:hypothetical protein